MSEEMEMMAGQETNTSSIPASQMHAQEDIQGNADNKIEQTQAGPMSDGRADQPGEEQTKQPSSADSRSSGITAEQDREKLNRAQAEYDARNKAVRDRQTAVRKNDAEHRGKPEERPRGLFASLRDFVIRAYHRAKHLIEQAIGRGRILAHPVINRVDFQRSAMGQPSKGDPSVDRDTQNITNNQEKGRNWGNLLYHGFARRILGKDAYMYAVTQAEKQENAGRNGITHESVQTSFTQPNAAGKENGATQATEPAKNNNQTKSINQEEMKGKFNALHKIVTSDLEDRFSNAKEAKEAYLNHYAQLLQTKLTEINNGEPVQVSASRTEGKLEIRINDQADKFGGYPSFMGCSKIRIEIDGHLNVTSAEAFVPTKQNADGKVVGKRIDVSDTLGMYVVSDLARNFREDYNRGAESYNLTSRNEFEKTIRDAVAKGDGRFSIDNITYTISVKDKQIQISRTDGDRTFSIAMDANLEKPSAAKQEHENKVSALQNAEQRLHAAEARYNELMSELGQKQEACKQALAKAMDAAQTKKDLDDALKYTRTKLSGEYPGSEKMAELKQQEKDLLKSSRDAFKNNQKAGNAKNMALMEQEELNKTIKDVQVQIDALKSETASLRSACEGTQKEVEAASQQHNADINEVYQAHVKSVTEDRQLIIHAFEDVLPGYKNELGCRLGLEDLNMTMEGTGRTYMEEALNEQTADAHEELSIRQEDSERQAVQDLSEERE